MDGLATPRKGPRRRYSPEVEAEQARAARVLAESGATWAEIITAFGRRGWVMSQSLLQRRFREWGITRGW